jgi:hypothetical protein
MVRLDEHHLPLTFTTAQAAVIERATGVDRFTDVSPEAIAAVCREVLMARVLLMTTSEIEEMMAKEIK